MVQGHTMSHPKNSHSDNSQKNRRKWQLSRWSLLWIMVLHVVVPKDAKYKRELRESIAKKRRQLIIYFFFWGGGGGGGVSSYLRSTYWGWIKKLGDATQMLWKLKNRFEDVILSAHLWRCIAPISSALGDKKFLQLCFQRVELSYHEYVQFQPIIFSQFNQGHQWKAISQRPWAQIAGSSLPRVPENVRGTVESQLGCFRVRWLDYIILMKVHPNSLYYTASLLVKIPNITIPGFGYPNAE